MFHSGAPFFSRISHTRAKLFIGISLFLIVVFWNTPFVFPIKIFVVFLHELSHAVAALLTGGKVIEITLDVYEGGSCETLGGNPFLILNAGYLGSLFWGGFFLIFACRTGLDRVVTFLVGVVLLIVTAGFVKNDFGAEFGYLAGIVAIVAALVSSELICEAILIHVGLTSCLYAVFDIISDVFDWRKTTSSDAVLLSELTGFPTVFWGTIWLLIAFFGAISCLQVAMREEPTAAETGEITVEEESG